jgi:hypothetical protein
MEPHQIPNLANHETGYRHGTSGELVAVAVRRRPDGAENLVAFEVQARVVDDQGATVDVDGVPAVTPWFASSVSLDGIVEGRTTLDAMVEAVRQEQAQRALRYQAAIAAYRELPA